MNYIYISLSLQLSRLKEQKDHIRSIKFLSGLGSEYKSEKDLLMTQETILTLKRSILGSLVLMI